MRHTKSLLELVDIYAKSYKQGNGGYNERKTVQAAIINLELLTLHVPINSDMLHLMANNIGSITPYEAYKQGVIDAECVHGIKEPKMW